MATASLNVKAGKPAPPPGDPKCLALKARNEAEREKFIKSMERKKRRKGGKLSQDDQKALDKAKRGGMTYSSSQNSFGGSSSTMTQSSSGLANGQVTEGGGPGGTSAQKGGLNAKKRRSQSPRHDKAKKEAGVLCNGSHVHPGGGKGAHAEAKIANNLTETLGKGAMAGGSMLLNIDWRKNVKKKVQHSGMPCADCHKMLCAAMKEPCNIKIQICDYNNEPQTLTEEDCADPGGYENLCEKIDGDIAPGRFTTR